MKDALCHVLCGKLHRTAPMACSNRTFLLDRVYKTEYRAGEESFRPLFSKKRLQCLPALTPKVAGQLPQMKRVQPGWKMAV